MPERSTADTRRTWSIRKTQNVPFDSAMASIIGPATEGVVVVERLSGGSGEVPAGLREAAQEVVDVAPSWTTRGESLVELERALDKLRAALRSQGEDA